MMKMKDRPSRLVKRMHAVKSKKSRLNECDLDERSKS